MIDSIIRAFNDGGVFMYAITGGLGEQPLVFLASFENHTDLDDQTDRHSHPR